MARTASGANQLRPQWIPMALSLVGIGPEHKVGHSPPASFVVFTILLSFIFMLLVYLQTITIRHKDKFTSLTSFYIDIKQCPRKVICHLDAFTFSSMIANFGGFKVM
jgi:hypothetical protein